MLNQDLENKAALDYYLGVTASTSPYIKAGQLNQHLHV